MLTRELILLPAVALVLLTAIVWMLMYTTRMREMRERRVRPQTLAFRAQTSSSLSASGPADNYMNLFEMPVLFYVLILTLYVAHLADTPHLVMAWLYVALRVVHSFIHVTYNRVVHRFIAFALSSVVLWIMWGRLALQLVERIADGTI